MSSDPGSKPPDVLTTPLRAGELHHPFPAERYLAYLSWTDVRALPKANAAVILSIASVEQHGPHLPLITDSLTGQTLLGMALQRIDASVQAWVLPPLAYGKSNEHVAFPGTVTLSDSTLRSICFDIARSIARAGFLRLVLLNSHGGNPATLEAAARDIREETGLMVFPVSTYRLGIDFPFVSDEEALWGTHANEWETAMVLAMAPERVRMERTGDLGEYPHNETRAEHLRLLGPVSYAWMTSDVSATGVLGDPRGATPEKGRERIDATVARLAEVIEEICSFRMPRRAGEKSKSALAETSG